MRILYLLIALSLCLCNPQVDVQISNIDSSLIKMNWCGSNKDNDHNVVALTSKGTVYRSDDKGVNWKKMSEVFHRKGVAELDGTDKDKVGQVNNLVPSAADHQALLFTGTESVSWVSLDCGKSVTALTANGRQLREFQFHPINKELVLASAWKKCPTNDQECFTYKELLLSENAGLSWHSIATHVNQFQWAIRPLKDSTRINFIPENRLFVSFDPSGRGHQSLSSWNTEASLYYTDDFFSTRTLMVPSGARFLVSSSYLFVAKVTNSISKEISLLVTDPYSPLGYNFDVIDADEHLIEHSYSILDTTEGQVFLVVNHLKVQSPLGVIYQSDSTGTRYTRSLENAVRLENGAEFHRVQGLEGIYIANVYHDEQARVYINSVYESQENGFGISSQSFKDEDLQKYKQSRITFDKGGQWVQLKSPKLDSNGTPIQCDPKVCSLHLHLSSTYYQFGPLYTKTSAIGIIISTGSVGKYLSYRPDQVNTYLSRDGGLTWFEIQKGSHIYEISDHGGIIIMASDQVATNEIKYSWNEGLEWETFKFTEEPIEITNIITEPTNTSTRFIVYGNIRSQSRTNNNDQGTLVTIDLDQLNQRKCIGTNTPNQKDSDYETWTPSGIVNPDCLFGKQVTYVRRKRESKCKNPEQLDRIISVKPCLCTQDDYECDIGYKRDPKSKQCVKINPIKQQQPPQECHNYYLLSNGYRKIANDKCEGGLQFDEIKVSCPGNNKGIYDFLFLLVVVYGVYWTYNNQEKVKFLAIQGNDNIKKFCESTQNKSKKQKEPFQEQDSFDHIKLEDNEQGLGHREFDEDLIEKEQIEIKNETKKQPESQPKVESIQLQDYDEDTLI